MNPIDAAWRVLKSHDPPLPPAYRGSIDELLYNQGAGLPKCPRCGSKMTEEQAQSVGICKKCAEGGAPAPMPTTPPPPPSGGTHPQ